jgi:diguanylate cyclase (GGDEF)-like protein/PAS domain S-box-containing protein
MSALTNTNVASFTKPGTKLAHVPAQFSDAALRSIGTTVELETLLAEAVQSFGRSLNPKCALFLLDKNLAELKLVVCLPSRPEIKINTFSIPMDRRLLLSPRRQLEKHLSEGYQLGLIAQHLRSFGNISLPISVGTQFAGVLILDTIDNASLSKSDIDELEILGKKVEDRINISYRFEKISDQLHNSHEEITEKSEILELIYSQTIFSRTDTRGRIVDINDAFCEISGYQKSELIGSNHRIINSGLHSPEFWTEFWSTLSSGSIWRGEICNRSQNGELYWVDSIVAPMRDHRGKITSYISVRFDITERKRGEEVISRFGRILDGSSDEIYVIDQKTSNYIQANAVACKNLGYSLADLSQMSPGNVIDSRQNTDFENALNDLAAGITEKVELEATHIRNDGSTYPVVIRLIYAADEVPPVYVATVLDVSEQKMAQAEIERLAYTDPLTGLPNRASTLKKLGELVKASELETSDLSLLFVDLDRFKEVNDTRGHQIGDEVLRAVSARFQNALNDTDLLGRVGGDEFVIVLPKTNEKRAIDVAVTIHELMKEPVAVEDEMYFLGVSVGVTTKRPGECTPEALVRRADTAMYNAKALGQGVALHHTDMTLELKRKRNIANWLKEAIERNDLSFAFQPQVDLPSREFIGAEVLLRWHNSPIGEISPGEFIPIAEERGMMPELGEWVFTNLCKLLSEWSKAGWRLPDRLAINISAAQLTTPNFQSYLSQTLKDYGLPSKLFELEITEHALMSDTAVGLQTLRNLKSDGFSVAIDDFGTGYSSLSHVKSFAADKLKIDLSFVHDMHKDDASFAIVSAIVAMAESLGMNVVAEGVEQDRQASTLRALGCDQAQGFLYSKPLAAETFRDDWMTRSVLDFSLNA